MPRLRSTLLLLALSCAVPLAAAGPLRAETGSAPPELTLDEAASLLGLEAQAEDEATDASEATDADRRALPETPAALPDSLRRGFTNLQNGRFSEAGQRLLLLLGVALVLLFTLLRVSRGRGSITVALEYPAELRGTFAVKLSPHSVGDSRVPRFANPTDAERARRSAGGSTAHAHFGVARETQFLQVPCRRTFVLVDGYLQTAESDDVVSAHCSEQEVLPQRGDSVRVSFDFQPRACPLEVRVAWDRRSPDGARVARYAAPGSLRRVRGPVQYSLDRGRHQLVAGSNDRVAEVVIEVDSFQPRALVIDLGDRDQLLFTGCPAAVEPYLNGDVPAAARALERDGQTQVSQLLLARFHEAHGEIEKAARHYENASEWGDAARLYRELSEFDKAAGLFEQIGEHEQAGAMYRSAGKLLQAGESYGRAKCFEDAAMCFRSAGELMRWADALSQQGRHLAAATAAQEQGERALAIQYLHRVSVGDADYVEAAMRLGEAYHEEGHLDLAARKLEELVATRTDADVPSQALDRLASLYEESRDYPRALEILERLRTRDATWPHVASRVEAVMKARQRDTTHPDSDTQTQVNDAFADVERYDLVEEIGRGGMGVVFRARDRRLGREVALKRLPDHIRNHPKAIELFLREARAAAALNHPNIVTLFDAGQQGDTLYITMELLEGMPLQQILRNKGRLDTTYVAKIGGQVAMGLEYAHEQGIVHRDIKTANLFFTRKKLVKIMDFGLAKMVEEVRRSTTVIGGTPYYMAPEQSAGEQVDHRADLYALGITFYELLSGKVPFCDGDVAFHHRHTTPPDLRESVPDLPDEMAELVAALLEKQPSERIGSAGEVVRRLAEIASR